MMLDRVRVAAFALGLMFRIDAGAASAITIDGRIEEDAWLQAQKFSEFQTTEPFTRSDSRYPIVLRILAHPEALYAAVSCAQPRKSRTYGRSTRDAKVLDADSVTLYLDLEGRGQTAHELTVSLSGTQRDGVVLDQTTLSADWDGPWTSAVYEDDDGWTTELAIPWLMATGGNRSGERRTIGFYASCESKKLAERWARPGIELLSAGFIRRFERIEISHYEISSLEVTPYAALTHDELRGSTTGRAGVDLLWKPGSQQQLAATVFPDFGQVESDDLVVNFTAIETLFEERRPFFTEAQEFFDVRTTENGRLVNTRRIGAAPDVGLAPSADIVFAGRYSAIAGAHEYGALTAIEDDWNDIAGREYVVGRYRHKGGTMTTGYLGTYVDRAAIDRQAAVHALDMDLALRPGISLRAQTLISDVTQRPSEANFQRAVDDQGVGTWLAFQYQPGTSWENTTDLTWFDDELNFNDVGYQERGGIVKLRSYFGYLTREYPRTHPAQSGDVYLEINTARNNAGETLVSTAELGRVWTWKNGSTSFIYYFHETAGIDDLISRGNGSVRLPTQYNAGAGYGSPATGRFRFTAAVRHLDQGLGGPTRQLQFKPKWFFSERFSVGMEIEFYDSRDWLVWLDGDRFGRFRRDELNTLATLSWFPTAKQELRLKTQWVGLDAKGDSAFRIGVNKRLTPDGSEAEDFTVSSFGLQLRYRYELRPLSHLYVVYSRGGDGSLDDRREGFGDQFSRAWNRRVAEQLFIKLSYRFY